MASKITITPSDETLEGNIPAKIIALEGQLDESNVDENAQTIYTMIDGAPDNSYVIFDLSGLTYMNSKSIGYMTDWHLKMGEKHGEIILTHAKENIMDILNVVGLTQIIKNFATLDEAKQAITSGGESAPAA